MSHGHQQGRMAITLAALGVVYGDLGTSPLYALKESFAGHLGLQPTPGGILSIASLFFWTIMTVVSFKYVLLVLRADDKGEGGILTLASLASRRLPAKPRALLMLLGLVGVGLFIGDAVITPAISVLSAVEGLQVITPELTPFVLPITLTVLVILFGAQHYGTAGIGRLFGPIMLLWFGVLAALGAYEIAQNPAILQAVNPLYADMGHFGRGAIQLAWGSLVMPALLLNYFGQGALLLRNPAAIENPFYLLAPSWLAFPLLILATLATVIASQAVISGTYSVVRQAILLGYLPRQEIRHTSEHEIGQIYLPLVNWLLLGGIVIVILWFQSSSNLAAAYGIAVTGTMALTTLLLMVVAARRWKWSRWLIALICAPLLLVDVTFFAANTTKFLAGGWLPILFALLAIIVMTTWKRGRELVLDKLEHKSLALKGFVDNMLAHPPLQVPGTAVFLSKSVQVVPHAMLHNLKHNKILHERVIFLTVQIKDEPWLSFKERIELTHLGEGFWQVVAHFGYKEVPSMEEIFQACAQEDLKVTMAKTSFFLSHENLVSTDLPGMARWREGLFVWMNRNSLKATDFFHIPANRVVELGVLLEL
ncbi:potassium transporter Kup [Aeromonas hydrophila]|uniref:potassium transporter Kup n=1 Tax=Aeromonas hydrophila TaxID=644 RepID=UPI000E91BD35|nr:potassium transporter Kup [Aeromonas hydrophila]AXV34181.1 potassium transporter Kup [Aeromonas hydrophila]MCX4114393.1 potassium transporter Kup [Aeromonas hydrophila]MDD9229142.1 potassium transporter Kup [Aeromonas hydrophila]UUM74846.1 potassium transporter Kup [Aeromonas hydrophila]